MTDEEIIEWLYRKYNSDNKYEFKFINESLIGKFSKGTTKLCETFYRYAIFKSIEKEKIRVNVIQ